MATNLYKVVYHAEAGGHPLQPFGWRQEHIAAADGNPATLVAILNSNGKGAPAGASIVFDSIANSGVGQYLT